MEWQTAFALMEEMLVTRSIGKLRKFVCHPDGDIVRSWMLLCRLEYSAVTYMAATRACGRILALL